MRTQTSIDFSAIDRYVAHGFNQVDGWCVFRIFDILKPIVQAMPSLGGVAEIGAHHGKFFIGLHNMLPSQKSLAIDVFDMQEFNIDHSGEGNKKAFLSNLKAFGTKPGNVSILEADSLSLLPSDISELRQTYGGFSLFSIDGGHTAEHTISDFRMAEQLMAYGGIMILDDYWSDGFCGVNEGIARLFILERPKLVPCVAACQKLIFAMLPYAQRYAEAVRVYAEQQEWRNFPAKMYGHDIRVVHAPY